jgi:superfamily II DNA helicase RecQ
MQKLDEIKKYANIKYYCKRKQLYKYFNEIYPEKYKNGCNKCVYCINKGNIKYCVYVYKKGENIGTCCNNIIDNENKYCNLHIKYLDTININKEIIDDLKNDKLCGMLKSDGKNFCRNRVKNINEKCYIHKFKLIKIE